MTCLNINHKKDYEKLSWGFQDNHRAGDLAFSIAPIQLWNSLYYELQYAYIWYWSRVSPFVLPQPVA